MRLWHQKHSFHWVSIPCKNIQHQYIVLNVKTKPALLKSNTHTKEIYTWLYQQVFIFIYSVFFSGLELPSGHEGPKAISSVALVLGLGAIQSFPIDFKIPSGNECPLQKENGLSLWTCSTCSKMKFQACNMPWFLCLRGQGHFHCVKGTLSDESIMGEAKKSKNVILWEN